MVPGSARSKAAATETTLDGFMDIADTPDE
jgi:hypothetical protein